VLKEGVSREDIQVRVRVSIQVCVHVR
jgi:hypothetical protein